MKNSYLYYYRKSFVLLNKNLYIYLLNILFLLGINLNVIVTNFSGKFSPPILSILVLPFYILFVSYFFVPIVLFDDLSKNKKITFGYILKKMRQLFLKTLLPFIAMSGLFMIIFFVAGLFLPKSQDTSWFSYFGLIISLVYPLFFYFGIYYVLKEQSVGDSLVKSVTFALKNLKFTYLTLPYIIAIWLVNYFKLIPATNNLIYYFVFTIISTYITTLIQGAVLFYFKGKTGENKS